MPYLLCSFVGCIIQGWVRRAMGVTCGEQALGRILPWPPMVWGQRQREPSDAPSWAQMAGRPGR